MEPVCSAGEGQLAASPSSVSSDTCRNLIHQPNTDALTLLAAARSGIHDDKNPGLIRPSSNNNSSRDLLRLDAPLDLNYVHTLVSLLEITNKNGFQ